MFTIALAMASPLPAQDFGRALVNMRARSAIGSTELLDPSQAVFGVGTRDTMSKRLAYFFGHSHAVLALCQRDISALQNSRQIVVRNARNESERDTALGLYEEALAYHLDRGLGVIDCGSAYVDHLEQEARVQLQR